LAVIGLLVLSLAVLVGFVFLFLTALDKTAAYQDGIRADRCARMGENTPRALEGYCSQKGV
jgi:hypothetical protein